MGFIRPDGPEQAQSPPAERVGDMEKSETDPRVEDLSGYGSDGQSDKFQDGVQRVRAITTIWSKYTLLSMFVL